MNLSDRELATVLNALRIWQERVLKGATVFNPEHYEHFDGDVSPLSVDEVNALCERLNCYTPPFLVVTLEGGQIGSVCTDRPEDIAVAGVVVVDYDTDFAESHDIIAVPQDGGDTAEAVGYITNIEEWPVTPAVAAAMRAKEERNKMRDLFDAFDSTRFAISTEEARYYLNGVFLHLVHNHETGADELRFVATDGHRLALAMLAAPDGLDFSRLPNNNGPRGVIIPRKAIATVMGELSALLAAHKKAKTEPGVVTVSVSRGHVRFAFADASLTTKVIDGTFPDYGRVIPREFDKSAEFATKDALATIAAVSCIASERGRAVKLTFDSSGVEFLVTNPDAGSAKDKIAATFTVDVKGDGAPENNPTFEIGVNSAYLAECLEESRAETVCLRMADAGSPVRLESRFGNVAWLSVVMPMRV